MLVIPGFSLPGFFLHPADCPSLRTGEGRKRGFDRVEDKDMHLSEDMPVLNLPKLGIAPEHYEAIEKAVKELKRQGIAVIIEKE